MAEGFTFDNQILKRYTMKECLVCKRTQEEMPVTRFYYQKTEFYICAEHMPVLIHNPQQLIGILPGADEMPGV